MVYKVGIIGTGFGAKVHLPSLQHHTDFEVEVIAGRNEEKTEEIANEAGIKATTNWTELLDMDLDIITVSTPPYHHYKMAKAVLESEKNLLLEKPTTTTALQAKELISIASEKSLIGMMCHEFRWLPPRNYFEYLISDEKVVGKIREIHYHNFFPFAATSSMPKFGWLWDAIYDGGMLGAIGSHLVDQIRATTKLEFASVIGQIYTRTKMRMDENDVLQPVTSDDGFSILFELHEEVSGDLIVSTTTSPAPSSRFIVSGDKNTLFLQGDKIYQGDMGEFTEIEIPEEFKIPLDLNDKDRRIPPFLKLLDQLALSLDEGKSYTPNLIDGWKNQLVLDSVRKSHQNGTKVTITNFL